VLGLAYKPFSHVTEESQAILIVKAFLDHGARVLAYDPLARQSADNELGGRALIMDSALDCLQDADMVLVTTPDPEFKALKAADFQRTGRTVVVVDFWRILTDELSGAPGIEYVAYGRGPAAIGPSDVLKQTWGTTPEHYGS
jgi:UDPglucose 6-dehydrogenase